MLDETKLFDFIKILFTKPKVYSTISNRNKKRHQFMINRFFAIKYPTNANLFNINGINGSAVIDSWYMVASRFRSVPSWIYTKTKKTKKVAKNKNEYIPKDDAIKLFMQKNEIGKREFAELEQFAKVELYDVLRKLEESMEMY
tara:strand:+ start:32 stop:460 length:429 start_codon:yes stop_codon:yes gene_type:complete